MAEIYAHITGWGMSVPEKVLTNDDLAKMAYVEAFTDLSRIRNAHAEFGIPEIEKTK